MNTFRRMLDISFYSRFVLIGLVLSVTLLRAHNEVPGRKQTQPIALTNATIHTIANGTVNNATIVFDKGIITAVGSSVSVPPNARVIDCNGKHIYPGFIAPNTTIGLSEVDAVRSTRDMVETGSYNPNVRGEVAYNPDSEIIPTVRINGVLLAAVVPQGGSISGIASVLLLDGWTREDAAIKPRAALVVNIPSVAVSTAPWITKSADDQRKDSEKRLRDLERYFETARTYSQMARNATIKTKDIRLEAMRPVFESSLPVMMYCDDVRQIRNAIEFAKKFSLKAVLVGCEDAWQIVDEISESRFPVILKRIHSLPSRDEEGYDTPFRLPSILAQAKIPFAFSDGGSWQQRNLPFNAGTARAFGLSQDDALRALTLTPATIFGIEKNVGSLEIGKDATLFVSKGDALDALTNQLEYAFVQGRVMSLSTKQTRLAEKYRTKYKQ